MILNQEEFS